MIVGQCAYNGDWPWLVHVDIPGSGCSASLILENYVITAQHCYGYEKYIPDGTPLDPVRIGSPDVRNGTVYGVEKGPLLQHVDSAPRCSPRLRA
ncbi:hypothetical protein AAVH_28248 [Aphelenchoides avenae]|nr:hypothetical protein AAVH_28248 [Aphelenchus avenae]